MRGLIVLLVIFIGCVLAQNNSTSFPPLSPSSDVHTAFVLPDHPDKEITAGDIVEVLLGFVNNGENAFNITFISASLNHPLDNRYYIQNYTSHEYGLIVSPKEQVSLSYRFRPDPLLEPRDFALVVSVYYEDESGMIYRNAFFNSTITIVEPDSGFDLQQLFLYVGFVGVIGLVGYFFLLQNSSSSSSSSKKERPYVPTRSFSTSAINTRKLSKEGSLENATTSQLKLDDDWLSGTNIKNRGSPAAAKRRGSSKN